MCDISPGINDSLNEGRQGEQKEGTVQEHGSHSFVVTGQEQGE